MSVVRTCYDWIIKQAEGPYASVVLFSVAFAESSFFPLPPDILLLPMALAERQRAWRYALICTLGSVLGGMLGYAIGAWLYDSVGQWIIATYHLEEGFRHFQEGFQHWGVWIILGKGLTPIPFKLVTIASGVARLDFLSFILAAAATRAFRFFIVAWLAKAFGEPIRAFVEKYLTWVALGILALIVFGFWLFLG